MLVVSLKIFWALAKNEGSHAACLAGGRCTQRHISTQPKVKGDII